MQAILDIFNMIFKNDYEKLFFKMNFYFCEKLYLLWLIDNRTSCRPIQSAIILVTNQSDSCSLRGRPILLITHMIRIRSDLVKHLMIKISDFSNTGKIVSLYEKLQPTLCFYFVLQTSFRKINCQFNRQMTQNVIFNKRLIIVRQPSRKPSPLWPVLAINCYLLASDRLTRNPIQEMKNKVWSEL